MADAGDIIWLSNSLDASVIPNAPSTIDLAWDTIDQNFGVTNSSGTLTLDTGKWLIGYSEYCTTTNTTNNERIEIIGTLESDVNGTIGGYGQGMIRKSSGDQECVVRGSMIYDVAGVSEDINVRFARGDNSTSGSIVRSNGGGGNFFALKLDGTHNFARYEVGGAQSLSTNVTSTIGLPTTQEQDTGFSIASDVVTVTSAGRYLITYQLRINQGATGREDVISYLRDNGSEITGTRGFCYLRGSDSLQDGALTWIGIVDLPAGATIDLRAQCPTNATINITAGGIQFWQLPVGNETFIAEATDGNINTNADFVWDTNPHIDAASFTHTAATSTLTFDAEMVGIAFATLSMTAPESIQRGVPFSQFRMTGGEIPGIGDAYHRNSGGTGYIALTAAAPFFANASDTMVLTTEARAATGTLNNDLAQWSVLSLTSVFGTYVLPPAVSQVDGGDNQVIIGQTGVVVDGARFGALQGSGKVELWSDAVGTTKVVQTVQSWSDTQITFDVVQGALANDTSHFLVITIDSGTETAPFGVFLGLLPLDDYFTVFAATNPDHWWRFDNDGYADNGDFTPSIPITAVVFGDGGSFEADPICEQNTHSWLINDQGSGGRREPSNSAAMNSATLTDRTMVGWVRFNQIDTALSCVYEEGGGVNNVCILIGLGGVLIASYADTGDDNAQAYSDFALEADRDYFIAWTFDHTGAEPNFDLYIDGLKQSVTFGNPLTSGNLDSHTGDITFGGQGSSLEVGGTDVTFQAQLDTNYANWASWRERLTDETILELFQRGARPVVTIAADTTANMQAAVDALADTAYANHAMTMRIEQPSDALNLAVDFDNITFDDSTSIQVEWRGGGTLTVTNLNGANVDSTQCYPSRGGSVVVVNPAVLTLNGLQNPTEVRVYEAGTTTELAGEENVTTGEFSTTIQTSSVDIVIAALEYQNIRLLDVDTSQDLTLPIQQRFDRNYSNP